jgi:hypothetical protein
MSPLEQALADIRAIPTVTRPEPAAPLSSAGCCSGDRNGYQWHINHEIPPCDQSREANRLWHANYRARRREVSA